MGLEKEGILLEQLVAMSDEALLRYDCIIVDEAQFATKASAKFNYKNSEWGIDYFNKNGKYHSRLESHETFYLGDRTIDRIKDCLLYTS